jgi:uncharacterized protein (TIRG00374 family)
MLLRRGKEILLAGAGLALLGYMIHRIGLDAIREQLAAFGPWRTLGLVLLYGLFQLAFAAGWWTLFRGFSARPRFRDIFLAYAAGDAVNMTVPSGNLAGEPVKVMLLKGKVPTEEVIASVTIYKFSDVSSMALFLLLGWLAHFAYAPMPGIWSAGAGVVILGMSALCVALYFLQTRGLFGPLKRWFAGGPAGDWIAHKLEDAHLIDGNLQRFYREHSADFARSFGFNLVAWFGGVLEIAIFLKLMGLESGFWPAFMIETFTMLINNLIFFIPARIGVGEGARILLFQTLGYSASAGLSYGLVRRIRELAWIGAGYLLLLFRKESPGRGAP